MEKEEEWRKKLKTKDEAELELIRTMRRAIGRHGEDTPVLQAKKNVVFGDEGVPNRGRHERCRAHI